MRMYFFKNMVLTLVTVGMICCGCSSEDFAEKPALEVLATVTVSVGAAPWKGAAQDATRAAGEMLTPVTLLVVPEGSDDIAKKITVANDGEFNVKLDNGTYDLVAVCGLEASLIQELFSDVISVPTATDFAVGKTSVKVANGVCTPSVVNITADRQMSWLDVILTGVPENVAKLNLYVKGLYESYSLDSGWKTTAAGINRFTQIPVTKNNSSYEGSGILFPCSSNSGVTYVAEATTTGGTTTMLTYTSSTPLAKGVHLTQTLEYGDMMIVEGGINLGGWTDKTDDGTFSDGFAFSVGQQYFSQAATVTYISSSGKSMHILAHKPMTATIVEMRSWDTKHIAYTLLPEISVQRWAMPTSQTSPQNAMNVIQTAGWDAIDTQFRSNNLTPIDRTATNIIAYWDKAEDKFYTYDFTNGTFLDVTDETGEFLFYPFGIVQLAE